MKTQDAKILLGAIILGVTLSGCLGGGGSSSTAPGFAVSSKTLTTSEAGTVASFTVTLKTKPTSDVQIKFDSLDTSEGMVKKASSSYFSAYAYLTFTPANWNVPQTVEVQGQSDSIADGNQTYDVSATFVWSMDPRYFDVSLPSVSVTNTDTDVKAINVSKTSLSTTENGGNGYFYVSLGLTPEGTVEVPITISDATEGSFSSSSVVTEKTLTFTSTSSQYVYVYPVDDIMADGNQTYEITVGPAVSSADADYNGLTGDTVAVTNADNDTAAFTISERSLSTNEWGQNATFDVVLNTMPTADVTIPVSCPDGTEGLLSSYTATPSTSLDLTFTSANWDIPQTVTVNGQDDSELDGDTSYDITVGAPTGAAEYAALAVQTVGVVNVDDDTARVNIQGSDLQTTEAGGGTDTFVVSLAKAPVGDVVINVTSSDTTEGLVKGGNSSVPVETIVLSFDTTNWQTAQTVTVMGKDDLEVDGNQSYTVSVAIDTGLTTDTDYAALSAQTVSVTNADDDVAGMSVTSDYMYTNESGSTDSFDVKLNTVPTADVIIPITVEDQSEFLVESGASGQVATLNLTFTPTDWATSQTVIVHAVDDFLDESTEYYDVTVGSATSADTNYNGLTAVTRRVSISDNDTAGFVITPSTGLITNEDGRSSSFTVKLQTEPVATAFVNVSSSNTAEGLLTGGNSPTTPVSAVTLDFTAANWQTGQTVTVHGVNDSVLDGPITYDVTVDDISGYSAIAKTATVTNVDNEPTNAEGTAPAPVDVTGLLPYSGLVDTSASYYILTGLTVNGNYDFTAGSVTDDINLYVYGSSDFSTDLLCSSTNTGSKTAESCRASTSSGTVYIKIDGSTTFSGAGFTLYTAPVYTIETFPNGSSDTVDTVIELYHSSDLTTYIARNDQGGTSNYSKLSPVLTPGETYYLKVKGFSSGDTGAYSVWFTDTTSTPSSSVVPTDSEGEPTDNTWAEATLLSLNTVVDRTITSSDEDWYVFTVPTL